MGQPHDPGRSLPGADRRPLGGHRRAGLLHRHRRSPHARPAQGGPCRAGALTGDGRRRTVNLPKPVGPLLAGYLTLALLALAGFIAAAAAGSSVPVAALVALGVGLAGLALALTAITARTLGRPLPGLARSVDRLARIALPGWRWTHPNDLGGIAGALGAMVPRLRDRPDELTEERDRASQILDALADGVLLLDGA